MAAGENSSDRSELHSLNKVDDEKDEVVVLFVLVMVRSVNVRPK